MDRNTKKSLLKNRVKLLNLDYFDLTAPLLAAEIFPTWRHKEIKTEASTGKARVDLLLEWMDESAPKEAFPIFLQGIRNCKELVLAKKVKKEASGEAPSSVGASSAPDKEKSKVAQKMKKEKSVALTAVNGPVANGSEAGTSTTPSRKRKSGADKPKGKNVLKVNGTQKTIDLANSKVLAPKAAPTATPRSTRKSSTMTNTSINESVKAEAGGELTASAQGSAKKRKSTALSKGTPAKKAKVETPKAKAASTKSRSKAESAAKKMTFSEVEKKQEDFRQKFKFGNSDAVVKTIHYNNKTDIFYQGCPTEMTKKICSKKVDLKGKEYVCEAKHHNTTYIHIPRLYVTFSDGTGDMQLTLFRKNVEIFAGKSSSDLDNMSDNEIKVVLEKSMGKKLNVEVQCDKIKKDVKKAGGAKWNNVATILTDEQGSKTGKKRKT